MDHRDAELADVVVVLEDAPGRKFADQLATLRELGLSITDENADQCVVEGTIEAEKVKALKAHADVKYLRSVFTYTADYPPGDPRNQDPEDDLDPDVDDAGA